MRKQYLILFILLGCIACHKKIALLPVQLNQYSAKNLDARKIILQNDGSFLKVYLKENPIRTPMLTLPLDRPFLTIAQDQPEVKFKRGSFEFKPNIQQSCKEQSIESIGQLRDTIIIRGSLCGENTYNLYLKPKNKNQLDIELRLEGQGYNKLHFYIHSEEEESFWGMGAQYSHPKLNGHRYPMWTEEQGIGRGDQPLSTVTNILDASGNQYSTYAPIPFYLSSENMAFHLKGSHRAVFDYTDPKFVQLEYWSHRFEASIWKSTNPRKLIEAYTKETGRFKPLPEWVMGNILGLQGGKEVVIEKLNSVLDQDIPVEAIWIQDWVGQRQTDFGQQLYWNWQLDENHYPDFQQLKNYCETKNIKIMGYINPFIAEGAPLEKEAKSNNYFVQNKEGEDYLIEISGFKAHLIDLSNPRAYTWLKEIIKKELIARGFDGWMADFGEWLPWDARLYQGDAKQFHNRYPVLWAKLNREAIQEMRKENDIAFFSRAAYSNMAKHGSFMWLGDQMTNWGRHDGIGSVVPALLSSGMSGIALNHADIGGFTSIKQFPVSIKRDAELMKRWIELCAFTPFFRNHESVRPKENLQVYDDEIIDFYKKFAIIHKQLKPYLRQVLQESYDKGLPAIRHLYLHYPGDTETYNIDQQFLLGSSMMVCPNVYKNKEKLDIFIPEGNWTHVFTGETFRGPLRTEIEAPLGQPAVFINNKNPWKFKF